MNPLPFVLAMCGAEILGMLSFAGFQALIPTFAAEWGLSHTEAGWISGVYFAGYVGAVPILVSLTDRIDPRRVLITSLLIGGAASLGYALFAEGFWTALAFRALHGVGLAGTYMPGLKALSDHIEGPRQSRYGAFYTSSCGLGAALSYVISGEVNTLAGWQWAFAAAAAGTVLAVAITLAVLPARPPGTGVPDTHLLDFRPVLRNREVMGYVLCYGVHAWELLGLRAWIVAFLAFSQTAGGGGIPPTRAAHRCRLNCGTMGRSGAANWRDPSRVAPVDGG